MNRAVLLLLVILATTSVVNGDEQVLEIFAVGEGVVEVADGEVGVLQAGVLVLNGNDDEAIGEVVAEVVEEPVEVEAVEEAADGVVGAAIGGFFQMIAGGFRGNQPPQAASNETLDKDIDSIESMEELNELEKKMQRDPNMQGMLPQIKMQFNSLRDAELRLVHLACNLRRSEFKAIEKDAKLAAQKSFLMAGQRQLRRMRGRRRGRPKTKKSTPEDQLLRTAIMAAARKELGETRAKPYQTEVDAREKFEREAVTAAMTACLDDQLMFSETQRNDVHKVLRTGWNDTWPRCVQYLANGGIQYFPEIPKQAIESTLDPNQVKIFKSIHWQPQNVAIQFFQVGNLFGFGQNQVANLEGQLKFAQEDEPRQGDSE